LTDVQRIVLSEGARKRGFFKKRRGETLVLSEKRKGGASGKKKEGRFQGEDGWCGNPRDFAPWRSRSRNGGDRRGTCTVHMKGEGETLG